ncbi:MAG TPA: DUF5667 domain-containing protein [Candidatus Nanoarchaeia archaeon]
MVNNELTKFEKSLKVLSSLEPDEAWVENLRFGIVGETVTHSKVNKSNYRWALSLGAFLVVIALGGGTIALADGSIPGDPLYPVKRSIEEVRLNLADTEGKISLQQEFTEKRVDELKALSEHHRDSEIEKAFEEVSNSISKVIEAVSNAQNDSNQINDTLQNVIANIDEQQVKLNEVDSFLPEVLDKDLQELQDAFEGLQSAIEEKVDQTTINEEIPQTPEEENQGTSP